MEVDEGGMARTNSSRQTGRAVLFRASDWEGHFFRFRALVTPCPYSMLT